MTTDLYLSELQCQRLLSDFKFGVLEQAQIQT